MDKPAPRPHGPSRHAVRYWRIRTALEVVKFAVWAILFTGWMLARIGWDVARDLI